MDRREEDTLASDLLARLNSRFYGPLMSFFLRRIKNRADAEDLTQETLLRAIRAQAVTHLEHAESYVFTIASNLLKDYRRRLQRFDPSLCVPIDDAVASELESQLVEDLDPERVLLSRDALKEALEILEELGERTRNIFVLFRLEKMKQKDIAAAYGIAQSTVEKHVMRAVMHLAARRRQGTQKR
jgi:RNA polymerase sigma-70 factor (ECF subfamily)